MGFWKLKTPKFRDVEEKRPALPRPEKVIFFVPHSAEHPAVLPLVASLSEGLGKHGIASATHSIEDMRERVQSLSQKLRCFRFTTAQKQELDALFYLQDAYERLRIVNRLLALHPAANIVEAHALDRDYKQNDRFSMKDWFYRIPGTRALYIKDLKAEYTGAIDEGLALAEKSCIPEALSLFGFDIVEMAGSLPGLLKMLEENLYRTIMLEIPAPSHCNCDGIPLNTRFERNYAYSFSQPHRLAAEDMAGILDVIRGN